MDEANEMPLALTKRNGSIEHNGLKIFRGGLGEFLICVPADDTCIGVTKSYRSAIAFTNGYAAGKAAR